MGSSDMFEILVNFSAVLYPYHLPVLIFVLYIFRSDDGDGLCAYRRLLK